MHSVHSIHHNYFFNKKWNPEIIEYYFYQSLMKIANSLTTVFIPVYLYSELKYSLLEISLFYVLWQLVFVFFVPFSSKVISKIGLKHTIALYLPFMPIFLFLLQKLNGSFLESLWLIILLLLIRNIPKAFNETADIIFVSKNILNKNHEGTSLAKLRIVIIVANLLAPLIGGAIAFFFGFNYLFNITALLFILAPIPLFLAKDKYFKFNMSAKDLIFFANKKLPRPILFAEIGRIFPDTAMWIMWPLFIFIVVKNTLNLGTLITASGIVSILIAFYIGKRVDKIRSKRFFQNSVKISTGIFYLRTIFADPFLIAIGDIIDRIFQPVLMVPYERYLYKYLSSINDLIEVANAKVFVTEFTYTLGTIMLAIIFYITSLYGISESLYVFLGIFFFFGLTILLMAKISQLENEEECLER